MPNETVYYAHVGVEFDPETAVRLPHVRALLDTLSTTPADHVTVCCLSGGQILSGTAVTKQVRPGREASVVETVIQEHSRRRSRHIGHVQAAEKGA